MKHVRILAAVPVVTVAIVLAGATQASAREVDPELEHHEPIVVVHDPGPVVPVDDTAGEARQAGAAALGGACIALAAVWLHRRRLPFDPYQSDSYEPDLYEPDLYEPDLYEPDLYEPDTDGADHPGGVACWAGYGSGYGASRAGAQRPGPQRPGPQRPGASATGVR